MKTPSILLSTILLLTSAAFAAPETQEDPRLIPSQTFEMPSEFSVMSSNYSNVDPTGVVPSRPKTLALSFFDANKSRITNQKYITIIDLSQHSSKKRMYIVNMQTGLVTQLWTAHGSGSDPDVDGWATRFSDIEDTHMSSIGFALSGSLYEGGHGTSMFLHGLEATNQNIYQRAIVMHGATYISPEYLADNGRMGNSWGCPAVEMKYRDTLFPQLQGGSLVYFYYNQ